MNERGFEHNDSLAEVKKFLGKIWRKWYWIAASLLLALTVAYLVNRYETPIYVISGSIITQKFDDNSSSMLPTEISGDYFFRNRIEVFQEIPLLKSQDKIDATLQRLDFAVEYFAEGRVKGRIFGQRNESYPSSFYRVVVDSTSRTIPYNIEIEILVVDRQTYKLTTEDEGWSEVIKGTYQYGEVYNQNGFVFAIYLNNGNPSRNQDVRNLFIIKNRNQLVNEYRSRLNISWAQKGSAILNVNMRSTIPEKDMDFIKNYFDVVIIKGLEEKNAYATNSINFINEQLAQISDSLIEFQSSIDNYKLANRELANGNTYIFSKLNEMDQQKAQLILTNRYLNYLSNYIKQQREEEVFAPNVIGLEAPLLEEMVNKYMQIKMGNKIDKNEKNDQNPLVNRSHEKIARLEDNMFENIENMQEANQEAIQEINQKIDFYYSSIRDFQDEYRELAQLQRMFALNEGIYNMLLERKTEASIAKASTTSDYQVVNRPGYSSIPIHPNQKKNYMIAVLLGLGIPVGLIYLQDMLNNKIITKDDLIKNTSIPMIGNIGHSSMPSQLVVKERPRSQVSESFRSVRANLKYFIGDGKRSQKVYLITSSISGEGKTFCSINLALTFANTGKKTLLLGADMRKPTLSDYLNLRDSKGLSNYLAGFNDDVNELILNPITENFYVLMGGDIPPNPAELLASEKMVHLMDQLREEFDHIIIDTPPIGLVSDAMELVKLSDLNFLVVRQSKTLKSALHNMSEMYNDGKVKNMVIVFNDINFNKYAYGYGYGYGYGNSYGYGYGYYEEDGKNTKWWRRLFPFL